MKQHNKIYDSEYTYQKKLKTFQKNQALIKRLNSEQATYGIDVEFELNHFADMTTDEFHSTVLMPKRKPVRSSLV